MMHAIGWLVWLYMVCVPLHALTNHHVQLSMDVSTLAMMPGGRTMIPLSGTQNIRIQLIDDRSQMVWEDVRYAHVHSGRLTILIDDPTIQWRQLLEPNAASVRLVFHDQNDAIIQIPIQKLPYSLGAQYSRFAKQWSDTSLVFVDHKQQKLHILGDEPDAALSVSGNLAADVFMGNAELLTNITGVGLADGHSLDALNGRYKDVVLVDAIGHVGLHQAKPRARVHVSGGVVFQGDGKEGLLPSNYSIPSGNALLWDSARSAFRSIILDLPVQSNTIGNYSIGFGKNNHAKASYASVLSGESNAIDQQAQSSVIISGQGHRLTNQSLFSVIGGGYSAMLNGAWSTIIGGRYSVMTGDYNVIIGGMNAGSKRNQMSGDSNVLMGQASKITGNVSLSLGFEHTIFANHSIAIGHGADIHHHQSLVVSDGHDQVLTHASKQALFIAKHGVGVNRWPQSNDALSVSGNVRAPILYGDGRYLTNISGGQSMWSQPNDGYRYDGPVVILGEEPRTMLTVNGGIQVGASVSAHPQRGTIQYTVENGLQGYSETGWVSLDLPVDQSEVRAGSGISMTDAGIDLDQMGAQKHDTLLVNSFREWMAVNPLVWETHEQGVVTTKKVVLGKNEPLFSSVPLVITTDTDALFLGGSQSLAMHPDSLSWLFNADTDSGSVRLYNSDTQRMGSYAGRIRLDGGRLVMEQSNAILKTDDRVLFQPLLQVSDTQMFLHPLYRDATFDVGGSVAFVQTMMDHDGRFGLAHKDQQDDDALYPYYLYQNSIGSTVLNSGDSSVNGALVINTGNQPMVQLNQDRSVLVGNPDTVLADVTLDDMDIVFHGDGRIRSPWYRQNYVRMGVSNGAIVVGDMQSPWMTLTNQQALMIGDSGESALLQLGDGLLIAASDHASAEFIGNAYAIGMANSKGMFSLGDPAYIRVDSSQNLGFLTNSPMHQIHVSGNMRVTEGHQIHMNDPDHLVSLYRDGTNTVLALPSNHSLQIMDAFGPMLVVSSNGQVGIGTTQVGVDETLRVSGKVQFGNAVYHRHIDAPRLIQPFTIQQGSHRFSSVASLILDESMRYATSNGTITLRAPPNMYQMNALDGSSIQATINGQQALRIQPSDTLSIIGLDSNDDGVTDAIGIKNPLLDGGSIDRDLVVLGDVFAHTIHATADSLTHIPYRWQLNTMDDLYYLNGPVGVGVSSPNAMLHIQDTIGLRSLTVNATLTTHTINAPTVTHVQAETDLYVATDTNDDDGSESFAVQLDGQPLLTIQQGKLGLFSASQPMDDLTIASADDATASVLITGDSAAIHLLHKATTASSIELTDTMAVVSNHAMINIVNSSISRLMIRDQDVTIQPATIGANALQSRSLIVGDSITNSISNGAIIQHQLLALSGTNYASSASVFAAESMAIRSDSMPLQSFQGVYVSNQLGIGVPTIQHPLHVKGDIVSSGTLTMGTDHRVTINATDVSGSQISTNYPYLDVLIPDAIPVDIAGKSVLRISGDRNCMSIMAGGCDNDIGIQSSIGATTLNVVVSHNATLHFKRNNSAWPEAALTIESDSDSPVVHIHANPSASSNLRMSDGAVGIHATPNGALTVDGIVKADYLVKNTQRLYPMPIGGIVMWSGSVESLPHGFKLCDGTWYTDKYGNTKQTPNLTDRFVFGAGGDGDLNTASDNVTYSNPETGDAGTTGAHTHTGGAHQHDLDSAEHTHTITIENQASFDVSDHRVALSTENPYKSAGTQTYYGERSHNHRVSEHGHTDGTFSNDRHTHSQDGTGEHTHGGGAHVHQITVDPPYYTLAFIIKVE